jgi:hypothetical protein
MSIIFHLHALESRHAPFANVEDTNADLVLGILSLVGVKRQEGADEEGWS